MTRWRSEKFGIKPGNPPSKRGWWWWYANIEEGKSQRDAGRFACELSMKSRRDEMERE